MSEQKCTGLCQSCVKVHDFGPHEYCKAKCRRCRGLGDACTPAQSLYNEYLPVAYKYFNGPGYTATGSYVEGFGESCSLIWILVALVGAYILFVRKSSKLL